VSQAKYYCKFCKQWMADNKATRQLHDLSEKHKSQVEYFHKKKSDEKLHGARSERDLKQQMEAINRAAREALATDLTENAGSFYSTNQHWRPPPPPPPGSSDTGSNSNWSARPQTEFGSSSSSSDPVAPSTDKAISENLRGDDTSGVYIVDDVTYLEGQYHEQMLVADVLCELFVEAEDDWCKAKILKSRIVAIAHTELDMKSFDVSYVPASQDEWTEDGATVELEVKSDRIRLIQAQLPVVEEPKIDESTGFGMWETVSVRLVDDVKEEKLAKARQQEDAEKKEKATEREDLQESSAHSDNAMSSYDVYNTGTYKGVAISKSEASSRKIAEEMESVANGKDVNFKKRKGSEGGIKKEGMKSKKRNIRKKTADDDNDD